MGLFRSSWDDHIIGQTPNEMKMKQRSKNWSAEGMPVWPDVGVKSSPDVA